MSGMTLQHESWGKLALNQLAETEYFMLCLFGTR